MRFTLASKLEPGFGADPVKLVPVTGRLTGAPDARALPALVFRLPKLVNGAVLKSFELRLYLIEKIRGDLLKDLGEKLSRMVGRLVGSQVL